MGTLNPNALAAWLFGASLGYTLDGSHGCALGLCITTGITFALSMFLRD